MNSHERRTTERRWPYYVDINHDDELLEQCSIWLHNSYGSCRFSRKRNPRWCFRLNYATQEFDSWSEYPIGAQIYFRRKEDYAWFLLKWEQ